MLNRIWPWFIIISIIYSFISGNINEINNSIFESSKAAINLGVTLLGSVALWCGLINILKNTNIIKIIIKLINPIIKYLFPETINNKELRDLIAMNIVSNFLGLGNAATPMGLKAINKLHIENNKRKNMSRSMMTLILINTTSIQLIPTTVFAIRKSLGSINPSDIIVCVWLSTITAATAGMITLKLLTGKNK